MDWYPWYPELFKADTLRLSAAEDGIYRRLIDEYMMLRRPLAGDDRALARMAGVGLDEWLEAAPAVRPFFRETKDGFLTHKRCDRELDYQDRHQRKLSESGKKGAEIRWSKNKELDSPPNGDPIATPMGSAIAQDRTGTRQDKKDRSPLSTTLPRSVAKRRMNGAYPEALEAIWKGWKGLGVSKGSKSEAGAEWERHVDEPGGVDHATVVAAAGSYCRQCHETGTKTVHVSRFIKREMWLDDLSTEGITPADQDPTVANTNAELDAYYARRRGEHAEDITDGGRDEDDPKLLY